MMFWAWAGVPLGVYNIVSGFSIALLIQPQILTTLSLLTWAQCYHYEHKWPMMKCIAVVVPIGAIMGAIELGLIFVLRAGVERQVRWPIILMAVLAALFLALGVLRHYLDIYLHNTVRGISFLFVGLDALGDLTSLLSVLFQPRLDVLGMVIYGVELTLWLGIFACGGYYNLLPRLRKVMSRSRPMSPVQEQRSVVLQDLPSSTSVFRTPSADGHSVRARIGGMHHQEG